MGRYVLRRLLELVPTTFGILVLTFILFHVVGGSPAEVVLGKNATSASLAAFDARYGYDKPLLVGRWADVRSGADSQPGAFRALVRRGREVLQKRNAGWLDTQFVHYVCDLARGDFGVSTEYDEPVGAILRRGVGPSLSLTVPILVGGTLIALALALLCAAARGGAVDRAVLLVSTVLMSVNYVVWILAGQFILAFKCHLFPIWGYENAFYLVLPVLIGIVSGLGTDVRFFRAAVLDEVYKPYVRTAAAKGLSETRIMVRHVLRNSLIPVVTYVSLSIPFLFTGSLMLESFFGIPGLGNVSLNAIHSADMAVVRAVVVLGALLYQVVNLFTDLCYAWLDPRVRLT